MLRRSFALVKTTADSNAVVWANPGSNEPSPGTLELEAFFFYFFFAIYEFMVGKVDEAKLQFRRPKRLPAVSERSEHYSTLLVSGMRCLHSAAHRCLRPRCRALFTGQIHGGAAHFIWPKVQRHDLAVLPRARAL